MAGQESDNLQQSTADMTVFVQNLLQQMQTRFQTMSESLIGKIDEMGNRIDELEQSINNLKAEMGTDGVSESKAEDPKPADESS
ncbi:Heat shock factor binding 1 protein [Dioscorea alata]|uniref:Heat shock factor binding 1 protein n=2 Tax=Dioscorea alata TaxID=55571 RepID=A0ACB7VUZ9_DIOAL|nr:Heat shock factor binding 1 protein [Dioscorea alata]KAH7678722.1 Heat shock factor binding 1 protein [Dioscorea alata]